VEAFGSIGEGLLIARRRRQPLHTYRQGATARTGASGRGGAELRSQIETVLATGLTPTHLDWHALADGGREDIFDLGLALAEEYRLAARVWLERGRRLARQQGLPVVDHDFLDSFSLDIVTKTSRYLQLLHELPAGLSEWAVHPGLGDLASREIDDGWRVRSTDLEFLTSPEAREAVHREGIMIINYGVIQDAWSRR
jgi:chitin disaccharide deacetylase